MSVAQAEMHFYGPVLGVLQESSELKSGREAWEEASWDSCPAGGRAGPPTKKNELRHGKMHRACLSRRRRGAENSRSAGPDRSEQSAAGLDPEGIRPDHHDQRRARFRLARERARAK